MSETRKLCLLHANCQGDEYEALLRLTPGFNEEWELYRFTNYTREPVPDELLRRADLFIYQHLEDKWGELASETMLKRLKPKAGSLCLPNMFFKGVWPFWVGQAPIDYGDYFLEKLIASGAEKAVILRLYLHNDLSTKFDLQGSLEETLHYEEKKEERCFCRTMPLLRQYWRHEAMFHTVNHPGKRLITYVYGEICRELGLTNLNEDLLDKFQLSYADFELPIHPQVAAFFNLEYVTAGSKFNIYGRPMSFVQYISRYIDCRKNNVDNFIGYLQIV